MPDTMLSLSQISGYDKFKNLEETIKFLLEKIEDLEGKLNEKNGTKRGGEKGKEW